MLDIKLIRTNLEHTQQALKRRAVEIQLEPVLALDEEVRLLTGELDNLRARRNDIARQIGLSRARKIDSSELEKEARSINDRIAIIDPKLAAATTALLDRLSELPNLPDDRAPAGGKENNKVVRTWGEIPQLPKQALDHVELSRRLGLVDYERGAKIGGSGFWLYSGEGAALEWALLDFFCRQHYQDGYRFFLPPHLLTRECGYGAGQFPKFEDDVFHVRSGVGDRERFLLPTAETAILNVYRDELLKEHELPIKCFAYSPCYRREGGSHRSEERGTIRGHQFNKVEMFQFVRPDDAEQALQELVGRAEQLVQSLGLHYRTSLLSAGDTSAAMALTYDIEVWIPSIGIYKEVSSVSWARDFQSRRANIRYKDSKQRPQFVHTLNGSGLATSRLLPAILEQLQQVDGSVLLPEPLRPWLGKSSIEPR